jgi:hypothetical protein
MEVKFKSPVFCIECGKELKSMSLNNDYDMVHGGIVDKISAGYGSNQDGSIFQIGICDICLDKKLQEKKIIKIGDYLFPEMSDSEDEEK